MLMGWLTLVSWLHRRLIFGEQAEGAVVRALAHPPPSPPSTHPPMCSIPARCHMWVEFVVPSRLAPRVFLRVLRFLSLHK